MQKEELNKLVNDKGNIPILILVLEEKDDTFIPKIVYNKKVLKNDEIRNAVAKALKDWINNLEPVG